MSVRVVAINLEWSVGALEREVLESLDATIDECACRTEAEVIRAARDADAIMSALVPLPATVLESLRRCKVVCEYGVGIDNIDLDAATRLGIVVCNVPDYGTAEVADHTLALALALLRRIPEHQRMVARGDWDALGAGQVPRLGDRSWGVIGYGRIGRAVARRAAAFGFALVAFDPLVERLAADDPATLVELDELLPAADVVSLHAPLTAANHRMIGPEQLAAMRSSAILVNVARGQLVDEHALACALRDRQLGGAGLDVLESEPPAPDHPLLACENVLCTPHAAFYSEGSLIELRRKGTQNIGDVLHGRRAVYQLN